MKLYKSIFTIACLTCFFNNLGFAVKLEDDETSNSPSSHKMSSEDIVLDGKTYVMSPDLSYSKMGFALEKDQDGYLKLVKGKEESYLKGLPLDSNGNLIKSDGTPANETMLSALVPINVNNIPNIYQGKASQNARLQITLPCKDNQFGLDSKKTITHPIIDSLGALRDLTFEFQRIDTANLLSWQVTITGDNPGDSITRKDASGNDTPLDSQHPLTIAFSSDGIPSKYDYIVNPKSNLSNAPQLQIIWDSKVTEAAPQSINLDLGKIGSDSGLTCIKNGFFSPKSMVHDGNLRGEFDGIFITKKGVVEAKFNNAETLPIYKIPSLLLQKLANCKL